MKTNLFIKKQICVFRKQICCFSTSICCTPICFRTPKIPPADVRRKNIVGSDSDVPHLSVMSRLSALQWDLNRITMRRNELWVVNHESKTHAVHVWVRDEEYIALSTHSCEDRSSDVVNHLDFPQGSPCAHRCRDWCHFKRSRDGILQGTRVHKVILRNHSTW